MQKFIVLGIVLVITYACGQGEYNQTERTTQVEWLEGTTDEKFESVTNQFGGFSQTMSEVNYRFIEMYWAGIDENWEYALYQLEHIEEALEKGFVRRPGREESANTFMNKSIPQLQEVFENGDSDLFEHQITLFVAACNSCHLKEDVAFMHVELPEIRYSYIRKPPAN